MSSATIVGVVDSRNINNTNLWWLRKGVRIAIMGGRGRMASRGRVGGRGRGANQGVSGVDQPNVNMVKN